MDHPRDLWDASLEECEAAVDAAPDDVDALITLANVYVCHERPNEAAALARRAEGLAPGEARAWWELGGLYRALEKAADARRCLDRAFLLQPEEPDLRAERATLMLEMGETDAAIAELEQLVDRPVTRSWPAYDLSRAYGQSGCLADAAKLLRRITQRRPNDWVIWGKLARTSQILGRFEDAAAGYRRASELMPSPSPWIYDLWLQDIPVARPNEVASFWEAFPLPGEHLGWYVGLGFAILEAGNTREALALADCALRIDTADGQALRKLGVLCWRLERFEDARRTLVRAIQADPYEWDAASSLYFLCKEKGGLRETMRLIGRKFRDDSAEPWELPFFMALCWGEHRCQQAYHWARRWLEQGRDTAEPRGPYSCVIRLATDLGDLKTAVETGQEAVQKLPDDADLHCEYGAALGYSGDFAAALQELMAYEAASTYESSAPWQTVLFLLATGCTEEARRKVQQEKQHGGTGYVFEEALFEYVEGKYRRAARLSLELLLETNPMLVVPHQRLLWLWAMALQQTGGLGRWISRCVFWHVARGRTGFARLAARGHSTP